MKKILAIVVLGLLWSGSANAAKRVCVAIHKDYKNLERPVLLAKRTMIVEASNCRDGNVLENPGSYKIYGFYKKKHRLFEKLYPYVQSLGVKGWDRISLTEFENLMSKDEYKTFNILTVAEIRKEKEEIAVAEKKKKEREKEIARIKEAERAKEEAKKPSKQVSKNPAVDPSLITIGSGSGFYINNKGYALTNNHVIDICAQSVAVIDGKETLFRVIATDKTNDVAVLKTDYKSRNFIKINEEGAKLGENVIAVGYPLAGRLSDSVKITRGIISSLSGLDNNIGQIQIDAALQPGNSGGPVLNENGELVGIASAGLNKLLMAKEAKYIPENVNFAVASPIVVNILKSKKIKYTTPSMFSGSYSNTELAELGDSSTIQLFCRNTRTAYNRLKSSNKYSTILLDLD